MNLFENKRAVSLTGVFALAFVGLTAYGFSVCSDTAAKNAETEAAKKTFQSHTQAALPPHSDTVKALKSATKNLKDKSLKNLEADLQPCINTCKTLYNTGTKEIFSPQHLASARKWLNDKIKNSNSANALSDTVTDNFTFGFDRDYNQKQDAAQDGQTPYLLFQLNAARTLAGYAVDAGATSIDHMFCEPAATEDEGDRTSMHIELGFTVKRGKVPTEGEFNSALSSLLNAIQEGKGVIVPREGKPQDAEYFFIVKGFDISTDCTYAEKQEYQPSTSDSGEPEQIAALLVGNEEDKIRFNFVIEAVYFSPSAN